MDDIEERDLSEFRDELGASIRHHAMDYFAGIWLSEAELHARIEAATEAAFRGLTSEVGLE